MQIQRDMNSIMLFVIEEFELQRQDTQTGALNPRSIRVSENMADPACIAIIRRFDV